MSAGNVVVEAFSELAPAYEETVDRELLQLWGIGYWDFVDRFLGMMRVGEGDAVLDVATGTALIPRKLAGRDGAPGSVVGLDITPDMLRHARAKIGTGQPSRHIQLVCGSGMELPFVAGTFDLVICGLGTHHMQVRRMLFEMRRVLRTGGRLLIADVGGSAFWRSFWGRIWLRVLMIQFGLKHSPARTAAEVQAFPNILTSAEWRIALTSNGFGQIEIDEAPARRRWFPRGLIMSAVARDSLSI